MAFESREGKSGVKSRACQNLTSDFPSISKISTANNTDIEQDNKMKLLTLNFLTCARKTCKSSPAAFPLHPKEAELEQIELDMNPLFIKNILPRLDWNAMKTLANEVCHFSSFEISLHADNLSFS